jgi:riboflavin kinase/FMN adenylyltransferase
MITWSDISEIPKDFAETAVSIGKFDALHLGHQALLSAVVDIAENVGLAPVVLTFSNHPNTVLDPDRVPLPVIGAKQKAFFFEEAGIEATLALPFDRALADLPPAEFVEKYLVKALRARWVLVGAGFKFGHKGSGSVDTLRELGKIHGFRVVEVPRVEIDGITVSTTRVREALDAGDVELAATLLGRNHVTTGRIEHGLKIGRKIGFPTANMARDAEGYLPLDAVYAGWLYADGERYPTALSVGINETFQAVPRLIEAHVIDRDDLDLYEKVVSLEYVALVRKVAKFDGVESLVTQINRDVDRVRDILA